MKKNACSGWAGLSVCLSCLGVTAGWAATPGPLPPQEDQELARTIFKELVEIKTTHDVGTTVAARAGRPSPPIPTSAWK